MALYLYITSPVFTVCTRAHQAMANDHIWSELARNVFFRLMRREYKYTTAHTNHLRVI